MSQKSQKQHLMDVGDKVGHHAEKGSLDGGKCLNRHHSVAPYETTRRGSCSHRWQAYEQMSGEREKYDYPKYKSLCELPTPKLNVWQRGIAWYAKKQLPRPAPKEWDYTKSCKREICGITRSVKNFYERSSTPYNHQAHHVIPNGELADTIMKKFSGLSPRAVIAVRRGLLSAGYNLNYKNNMIMLPMDKQVANAIGLPLHQASWAAQSHPAWSKYVKGKIESIFHDIKDQMEAHKKRDYDAAKSELESMSETLRNEILTSTAATLDAHAQSAGG